MCDIPHFFIISYIMNTQAPIPVQTKRAPSKTYSYEEIKKWIIKMIPVFFAKTLNGYGKKTTCPTRKWESGCESEEIPSSRWKAA